MSSYKIIGQQPPTDREIAVSIPELEQPDYGWDTLKETLWLPHIHWLKRGALRPGPAPEGGTFFVQNIRPLRYIGPTSVIVEVTSLGIATQDGINAKITAEGGSAEDLSLTAGVAGVSPSVYRLMPPRVTVTWCSLTSVSIAAFANAGAVPPDAFGYDPSPYYFIWFSPSAWSAYGWRGESRSVQKLGGCEACLVTDIYMRDMGYLDRGQFVPGIIYV